MSANDSTASSKSQCVKSKFNYRSKCRRQHGAMAHTKQQAIKDPKND